MTQGMRTLMAVIGRRAKYRTDNGLIVAVQITDIRSSFGTVQAQITPVTGEGYTWVVYSSLVLIEAEPLSAAQIKAVTV